MNIKPVKTWIDFGETKPYVRRYAELGKARLAEINGEDELCLEAIFTDGYREFFPAKEYYDGKCELGNLVWMNKNKYNKDA